ncbi:MAG: DUF3153 domain-containing protein [Chamaesiphon sp.]|nr:DUF3153 domain-containing protein [Chamaesiphon sp.]
MKIIVSQSKFVRFIDRCGGAHVRLLSLINRQLAIGFWAIAIALSGCVKYDTGVNFSSLNSGEIVEHIQLSEQLNSFSQNAVTAWIASIEQRTIQAQGHLERLNDRELQIIIPFNNAQELVTKIDRYFNPAPANADRSKFNAHMQVNQLNFLLVVRNHLTYDIDLRSLSLAEPLSKIVDSTPKLSVTPNNFVDLDFSLQSPWSVKNGNTNNVVSVKAISDRQMTWYLKPGELNHIDAIFWLPNSLGIGAILIILVSGTGYYLKYRQLPWQLQSK